MPAGGSKDAGFKDPAQQQHPRGTTLRAALTSHSELQAAAERKKLSSCSISNEMVGCVDTQDEKIPIGPLFKEQFQQNRETCGRKSL